MPIVGAPSTTAELILDPVSEDAGNVEVELTDDNNYGLIAHSYPTPPAVFQWASSVSTEGARLSSKRHENRTITISVEATGLGALYDLEAKITKLWREGGTLKRTYSDGREIAFDVLTVPDFETTFEQLHHLGGVTPVTVPLICKPYGRGAEQTLTDHVETTLPALTFSEATIPGDMPALGRLLIDNDVAAIQMRVWWGMRSQYATTASTAALYYQAESLTAVAATAAVGTAGASGSGSNVLKNTALTTSGVAQFTSPASGSIWTHTGSYRVFVRAYCPLLNAGTTYVGLRWVGAGKSVFTANTPVTFPDALKGSWAMLDLGMVNLPEVRRGDQQWAAVIDALSSSAGDDIEFDSVYLFPADRSGLISGTVDAFGTNAAISASSSVEVRHDGVVLKDPVQPDTWYGVPKYEGDYLLIDPGSADFIVKATRGLAGTLTGDTTIDDISARLSVTPRYLVVPEA